MMVYKALAEDVDKEVDKLVDKEVEVDTDGDDDQSCSLYTVYTFARPPPV